jgi:anti-anti-sigma regulatory factor
MSCKIDRVLTPDGFVVLRVSGRIAGIHVETLRELTGPEMAAQGLTIDLREVTLVSREAVAVLCRAEAKGIELRNCPAYVREWIFRHRRLSDVDVEHDT